MVQNVHPHPNSAFMVYWCTILCGFGVSLFWGFSFFFAAAVFTWLLSSLCEWLIWLQFLYYPSNWLQSYNKSLLSSYIGHFTFWTSLSLSVSLSPKFGLRPKIRQKVKSFLSASLYVSKRGAYWDRLCRDIVGRWLVGWLSRACTVAKRCILGL